MESHYFTFKAKTCSYKSWNDYIHNTLIKQVCSICALLIKYHTISQYSLVRKRIVAPTSCTCLYISRQTSYNNHNILMNDEWWHMLKRDSYPWMDFFKYLNHYFTSTYGFEYHKLIPNNLWTIETPQTSCVYHHPLLYCFWRHCTMHDIRVLLAVSKDEQCFRTTQRWLFAMCSGGGLTRRNQVSGWTGQNLYNNSCSIKHFSIKSKFWRNNFWTHSKEK